MQAFRDICELVCDELNALPAGSVMSRNNMLEETRLATGIQQELDACGRAMEKLKRHVQSSQRESGMNRVSVVSQLLLMHAESLAPCVGGCQSSSAANMQPNPITHLVFYLGIYTTGASAGGDRVPQLYQRVFDLVDCETNQQPGVQHSA